MPLYVLFINTCTGFSILRWDRAGWKGGGALTLIHEKYEQLF